MGTGEESSPAKASKATSATQETPLMPTYSDWSSSVPAYYATGAPPPFFASTVASPAPHPYMWGAQHPLIPPYGTPVPYPPLYAHGGVYAHPSMAMTPTAAHANMEMAENILTQKDQTSMKRAKSTSGVKAAESGQGTSGSGNDVASPSADSGSGDSSDASDENTNQQESSATKKGSFDQMLADGANAQNSTANTAVQGSMPATNLNIGMDLWNASPAGVGAVKMRPNSGGESPAVAPPAGVPDHQWIQQDERELKRQKRKQSNRESARRSRLRKQAECEELQARVETLSSENGMLKEELQRLSDETKKLTSENVSIKEELSRVCGADTLSNHEDGGASPVLQSCGGKGKC